MAFGASDLNEDYRFFKRIRFPDGNGIKLADVQARLRDECDSNGIPVDFRTDVLKTGGMFNKQSEDILVLYNTEHPTDYLQFLIRITYQGKYAFMDVFKVGSSKNYRNSNVAASGSTIRKLANVISGTSSKLQEEENFYTILTDCFENIIS